MFWRKHWTLRYIYDRSSLAFWEWRHPHAPWLTKDAIRTIEPLIASSSCGIEWGSGRSTAWFAARAGKVVSIEHDPEWAASVAARLQERGLSGAVSYRLCPDGETESPDSEYVRTVGPVPDESVDFCLVDGLCRQWCALAALDKLRPGGLLIVDNANWYLPNRSTRSPFSVHQADQVPGSGWLIFLEKTRTWRAEWTSNGVFDTLLLWKPVTANEIRLGPGRKPEESYCLDA